MLPFHRRVRSVHVPEEIGDSDILEVVRPVARASDPEISGERVSSEDLEDIDVLLSMVPRGGSAPVIPVTLDSALDVTGDPSVQYWSSPELPDFDDRETEVKISVSSFPSAPSVPASGVAPAPASSAAPISLLPPINPPPRRDGAAPSLVPVAMPSAPPSAAAAPMRARSRSIVIIHGRPSVVWTCGLLAAGALAAAAVALVVNAREQGGVRSTRATAAALTFEQPTPRAGHLGAAIHAPTQPDEDAAASASAADAPNANAKAKSAVAASAPHTTSTHAAPRPAPHAPVVATKPAPAPTHAAVAAAPAPAKPSAPAVAAAPAAHAAAAAKPMSPEDADALAREQLKAALR